MHRYLAVLWDSHNLQSVQSFQSLQLTSATKPAQWTIACEAPGTFVMHTGPRRGSAEAYPLKDNQGVVLGRVFDRHQSEYSAAPRIALNADETHRIVGSAGQHLVERYWGAYVAFVRDESTARHHVFRDPIGNVPCYHTRFKGVEIFFSHVEDCARLLPVAFAVDRQYLTRWLIYCGLTTSETGLENVQSVPAGERLTFLHGHMTRSILWDPIALAGAAHLEQADEAAGALRSTVQNTVDAWASCYGNITHKLSGGLDSSILAGCLAHAPSGPRVSYLNVSIQMEMQPERLHLPGFDPRLAAKTRAIAGSGDERYFARLVADHWKIPLVEGQRTLSMDLMRLWHTPLNVSPSMYYTSMEMDDAELELARSHGTEAFFSGQAGDELLFATQQPLPAIDYAHRHGLTRGLWEQLVATSKLSKESLWAVLGKAVRHGILRRPYALPFALLKQPTLVNEELAGKLTSEDFEYDLSRRVSRSALPPGKRHHVNGVAGAGYYDFVFDSGKYADHIDPLNSQPVWEVMLQIPTYTALHGGISRGLARRAFADLLPAQIRKRQVKGTGGPFYQYLVRRNRAFLRERLLDGLLVQQGYLDRRRVQECLEAQDPSTRIYAVHILNCLAAEVWLRQWTEYQRHGAAPESTMLQNATG
jgi:asparagine synthase (glutamine-hydrolysing)